MDFAAIRSRLAGAEGRMYWRSLGELADTPEFRQYLHREFPEQASEWNDPKGRRQFLKLMSASLALAGVGACTKQPLEHIVPYVRQPEDLVPGRPLFFASAIPFSGYAQPVLVESHMGRPTKIEGNPEHPASLGATDIFAQAAILGLYDPDRAQTLTNRGEVRPWGAFLGAMQSALSAQKGSQGAGIRFLTGPITSPSLAELFATILRDYPRARWHQYDPVARSAGRSDARLATGDGSEPVYHFDKADVVVSLEGDFLTCGPGTVRYQKDFAARRRVTDDRKEMNRLYIVESTPTLTGTKADHRLVLAASEIEPFARDLSAALGGSTPAGTSASVPRPGAPEAQKWIGAIAKDLQASRGRSIVIAGDYQPASVQALARAMNQALGNVGTTVTYGNALEVSPAGNASSLSDLVTAMDAGQVELLVILGGNPVYTAPADLRFSEKLSKVGMVVYHGLYADETTHLSHWSVAATHPLESWGDARSFDGTVTLIQPLIAPLYEGRSEYEVLGVFTPQPDRRGYQIVKDYWTRAFGGGMGWTIRTADGQPFKDAETFWRHALHDGFVTGTAIADGGPATPFLPAPKPATPAPSPAAGAAGAAAGGVNTLANPNPPADPSPELRVPSPAPSPERRAPSPEPRRQRREPRDHLPPGSDRVGRSLREQRLAAGTAQAADEDHVGHRSMDQPDARRGARPDQRRRHRNEVSRQHRADAGVGDAGPSAAVGDRVPGLRPPHGRARRHRRQRRDAVQRVPPADVRRPLVRQRARDFEDRRSVPARDDAGTSPDGRARAGAHSDARAIQERAARHPGAWARSRPGRSRSTPSTRTTATSGAWRSICPPAPAAARARLRASPRTTSRWSARNRWRPGARCTGSASITTSRGTSPDTVESFHQPVPCMQCENAPCEVVCPVAATSHSSEGLNDMVYNRCVGTRYCSNNCPYKVRRFNFLLYQDWTTPSLEPMRNPDVTVRSRGVMEKCTYCVQRINQARIDAKRDDRKIRDGEIVTACQAVCPSEAIVFGDLNDPTSAVSKVKAQDRNYGILEDLNTRPRTSYLGALRNPNPELETPRAGQHTDD